MSSRLVLFNIGLKTFSSIVFRPLREISRLLMVPSAAFQNWNVLINFWVEDNLFEERSNRLEKIDQKKSVFYGYFQNE